MTTIEDLDPTEHEDIDPATADDDQIVRMMRRLQHVRAELAETEGLFAREIDRLEAQSADACGPLEKDAAGIVKVLCDYLAYRQRDDERDGGRVRKSLKLPYGTIKSRRTSKIDVSAALTRDMPEQFLQHTAAVSKSLLIYSVKNGSLVVADDGALVVSLTGQKLPVFQVEETSFTVATEALA